MIIVTGKNVTFELAATRTLQFANTTIQENGALIFNTQSGNTSDFYDINVRH